MELAFTDVPLELLPAPNSRDYLENHVLGTLYGNCVGDAIGLLTEFMSREDALKVSLIAC